MKGWCRWLGEGLIGRDQWKQEQGHFPLPFLGPALCPFLVISYALWLFCKPYSYCYCMAWPFQGYCPPWFSRALWAENFKSQILLSTLSNFHVEVSRQPQASESQWLREALESRHLEGFVFGLLVPQLPPLYSGFTTRTPHIRVLWAANEITCSNSQSVPGTQFMCDKCYFKHSTSQKYCPPPMGKCPQQTQESPWRGGEKKKDDLIHGEPMMLCGEFRAVHGCVRATG